MFFSSPVLCKLIIVQLDTDDSDVNMNAQLSANMAQIRALEEKAANASLRLKERQHSPETECVISPKFLTHPRDQVNLVEGKSAHFEAKLEPVTDNNLQVEWLKNGQPIIVGHRFRPIHDFGYVALDIKDLIPEDSGSYTCRATNLVGSAESNFEVLCKSKTQNNANNMR